MAKSKHYRVAVNRESAIYAHYEPCGDDLAYAKKQYQKIKGKELSKGDTIQLQETDFSTTKSGNTIWKKVM
jgi:uncharacterized protein (AIM24 family)